MSHVFRYFGWALGFCIFAVTVPSEAQTTERFDPVPEAEVGQPPVPAQGPAAPRAEVAPSPEAPPPPAVAPAPAAPAAPAAEQASGPQVTVFVVDGAIFRGKLVEKIPGQYVTVRLSTGEHRRILWRFIARISESAETSLTPLVHVQFRADDERAVLQKLRTDRSWFTVCATPCAGKVSSRGVYRVGGDGIRTSESFGIVPRSGAARVDAEVGTTGQRTLGGILTIGGGVVAYVALIVFAAASSAEDGGADASRERTISGIVLLGSGAATVTGLVMLMNTETNVSVR